MLRFVNKKLEYCIKFRYYHIKEEDYFEEIVLYYTDNLQEEGIL